MALHRHQQDEMADPNFWRLHCAGFGFLLLFSLFMAYLLSQIRVIIPVASRVKRNMPFVSGLRWFAATFVTATHFLDPGGQPYQPDHPWRLAVLMRGGDSLVLLFLFLSGFFTYYAYAHTLESSGKMMFYMRRILRIIPAFYIAHILGIFVKYPDIPPARDVVGSFLFLSTWWFPWSKMQPNRMLWTVVSLVWCWIAFPLIVKLFHTLRPKVDPVTWPIKVIFWGTAVPFVIMMLIDIMFGPGAPFDVYIQLKAFPPAVFMTFVAGAAMAEGLSYMPELPDLWVCGVISDLSFFGALFYLAVEPFYAYTYAPIRELFWVNGYIPIWSIVFLSMIMSKRSFLYKCMTLPFIQKFGDYSAHIYMLQYPVYTVMRKLRADPRMAQYERVDLSEWALSYLLTLVAAMALFHLVEQPWVKFLKRVEGRSDELSVNFSKNIRDLGYNSMTTNLTQRPMNKFVE